MFSLSDYIPIEIQEKILWSLSGESLLMASKVCPLWFNLVGRIARYRCKELFPSECINEIEEAICSEQDKVWLEALNHHYLEQSLCTNLLEYGLRFTVELDSAQRSCYIVYGPLTLLGSITGEIEIYDAEASEGPVFTFNCESGLIRQLQLVTALKKLIIVSNGYAFYNLPNLKIRNYKMRKLKVIVENHPNELAVCNRISVSGVTLAILRNSCEVSVFSMEVRNEDTIAVKFLRKVDISQSVQQVSVWKGELLVVLRTGEIIHSSITTGKFSKSEGYHEIRYENPLWIFRDRIFCSTFISSRLLGLWHMESGTSYWLIGTLDTGLVRCHNLGTLSGNRTEEVLSVCLKQRLLFCGTAKGKVLIYRLSDSFFHRQVNEDVSKEITGTEFDRDPDFIVDTASERRIHNLEVDFTESKIYIITWSISDMKGTESRCFIECIVMSKRKGITQ